MINPFTLQESTEHAAPVRDELRNRCVRCLVQDAPRFLAHLNPRFSSETPQIDIADELLVARHIQEFVPGCHHVAVDVVQEYRGDIEHAELAQRKVLGAAFIVAPIQVAEEVVGPPRSFERLRAISQVSDFGHEIESMAEVRHTVVAASRVGIGAVYLVKCRQAQANVDTERCPEVDPPGL